MSGRKTSCFYKPQLVIQDETLMVDFEKNIGNYILFDLDVNFKICIPNLEYRFILHSTFFPINFEKLFFVLFIIT